MGIEYECGPLIPPRKRGETRVIDVILEAADRQRRAQEATERRTRLHYFGLAGGRR